MFFIIKKYGVSFLKLLINMKTKLRIIIFNLFISCGMFIINGQNIVIKGDSIEILLNENFKESQVQWQVSYDNKKWTDISGEKKKVFRTQILTNCSFRASLKNGSCNFYSDSIPIEVFDIKLYDENGKPRISKDSEYIIIIPDIQNYIQYTENNKYLVQMIDWIMKMQRLNYKIKVILQEGDLTEHNIVSEWEKSKEIFSVLDGKIPVIYCTGNHDHGTNGFTYNNRNTFFSKYFNYSILNQYYIESYKSGSYENSFFRVPIKNRVLQIFSIEFAPNDSVLMWANKVEDKYNKDISFLLTHAYLYRENERYNYNKFGLTQSGTPYFYGIAKFDKVNDGEDIWNKFVSSNINIRAVFSGHVEYLPDYTEIMNSTNNYGFNVHQMVFNTQNIQNGGNGWIKILEFINDNTINVKTYSPVLNQWKTDYKNQYIIELN